MECRPPQSWAGARWIGSVDITELVPCSHLVLRNHEGYARARLLIRENGTVRGFVDVEAPGGVLEREMLDHVVAGMPKVTSLPSPAGHSGLGAPSITVVVCTRNRTGLLRSALKTVLAVDYPNFDVLVVDNAASTSETADMIKTEFADSRVHFVSEPIPGLSHARNTGLRHARGEIVAYTDDDVVVDSAWLKFIADAFERVPAAACVTGLVPAGELRSPAQAFFDQRVSWSKSLTPKIYSLADPPPGHPTFPFCIGEFGTGANFALKRSVALSLGGFDTDLGVGTRTGGGEDVDMFTRVILGGYPLVVQPAAIVWHRHRDDFASLLVQARGYGLGLGAWLTKILSNPRTARIALARSPRAARSFLKNAVGSHPASGIASHSHDLLWDRQLAKVLRVELCAVALGPLNYLLEHYEKRRAPARF